MPEMHSWIMPASPPTARCSVCARGASCSVKLRATRKINKAGANASRASQGSMRTSRVAEPSSMTAFDTVIGTLGERLLDLLQVRGTARHQLARGALRVKCQIESQYVDEQASAQIGFHARRK